MSSPLIRPWLGAGEGGTVSGGGAAVTDFVFTVQTTGTPETFTIPCQDSGVFNAVIDWGDLGPTDAITAWDQAELGHSYAAPGTYTITISGTFPNIYFNNGGDASKVRTVENLGTVGWVTCGSAFYGCDQMTSFVAGNSDASAVQVFGFMFRSCSSATIIDVSGLDTSSANTMAFMFGFCSSALAIDVSGFDTSSITNMSSTFNGCGADFDVSGFDITSLTNATNMMLNSGMSTADYDATLINWSAQTQKPDVTINFGTSTYTAGGAAEAGRDELTDPPSDWILTDGGAA